jgi:hypothetical protein
MVTHFVLFYNEGKDLLLESAKKPPQNGVALSHLGSGGEGGIRTHGTGNTGTTVFETASFNHSDTSP